LSLSNSLKLRELREGVSQGRATTSLSTLICRDEADVLIMMQKRLCGDDYY
jgi:hypothetical protein